jgi:molybdopterin synthase sulfur carrier subunit
MPAKVRIPAPLRKLTNDQAVVEADGNTIQDLLASLDKNYPGLKDRICDESGQIRRFVNIFVNGEDIRFKSGPTTAIQDGAEVSIIPAIAGGLF